MITGHNTDPKKENYLDNSSHFEVDNDLDYSEEIFWEAPETLTAHNTDPEKKSYLDNSAQFKEGPKKKNHLDDSSQPWEYDDLELEEIYWETAEAATSYLSGLRKGSYKDSQLETEEYRMAFTNDKIESEKEKDWEADETNDSFNSVNKKVEHSQVEGVDEISVILGSTARDKDCKISNERMKKTWESIHAPSTTDDEKRVNMTSQNKRNRSKKISLTNVIPFSIIIGQAFTKEIGGLLVENNIL